ncbi:hypothetical protein Bbelb_065770 [Branchiostoma belcheri]|nr:hypothetical protein Bbelb_065770 [Branchiostoma belcheri]
MFEQAEPVRTPQVELDREQNNRPRAPYPDPSGRRGNTSGYVGCNVEMYEQAEPVRTPQAWSGREHNNRPRAPYPDPPARRDNTGGHVGRDKQACQRYQLEEDSTSNVYEEAESVKLKNISGDAPFETDSSTDTAQPGKAKSRRVCYIAAALAVVTTLVIVGIILLITIYETYDQQTDISTAMDALNRGHGQNQTESFERLNEDIAAQCPLLSPPPNGFVTGSNYYGDVVNFTCMPGYKLVGTSALTCLSDGTWDENLPTCTAVQCPPLPNPVNGFVTSSNSYGDVVNFTCEPRYRLDGKSSLTCLSDGTWNGTSPTCAGQWLERDSSWVVDSAGTPWVDEDGIRYDAAKALDGDEETFWNTRIPNGRYCNNWYIILYHTVPKTLTRIAVNNFGDTTHDIAAFILQKSCVGSPYIWEDVVSVDDVIGGTRQRQEFGGFRGTSRYWRFLITRTHSGYQPWLRELDFYGISQDFNKNQIITIDQIDIRRSDIGPPSLSDLCRNQFVTIDKIVIVQGSVLTRLLIIVLNAAVLWGIFKTQKLCTAHDIFTVNVAMSDLVSGVGVLYRVGSQEDSRLIGTTLLMYGQQAARRQIKDFNLL